MLDHSRPVEPGSPLRIPAKLWNALLRIAQREEFSQHQQPSAASPTSTRTTGLVVLVHNSTGNDRAAGDVLALDGAAAEFPDNPREAARNPVLTAHDPATPRERIVVLLDPIAAGNYGRGVIAGIATCTVEMLDADHQFAAPTPGGHALTSAASGPVAIVAVESAGTGSRLAVVFLQVWPTGEVVRWLRVTDATVHEGTGTVAAEVLDPDGSGGRSTGTAVRLQLIADAGSEIVPGVMKCTDTGTTVTIASVVYPLYDCAGNDIVPFEHEDCVDSVAVRVCQELVVPHPALVRDVECEE